jgi:hypothetical protein
MRVGQEGSAIHAAGASFGDSALLANSVREDETALCLDCSVTFNIRNRACPKCGGEQFWLTARWRAGRPRPVAVPALPVAPPTILRPAPLRLRTA